MGEEITPELNTDQLIEQMQADELEDDESPLITPVNYSKIRPFKPQQVFYHIRAHHLKVYFCPCGRKCINKQEADVYFRSIGKLQKPGDNDGQT
jgi:hypothetical protein